MFVVPCVNLIDRGRSRRNIADVDPSPVRYNWCRDQDWKISERTGRFQHTGTIMSKMSGEGSEVVSDQPEKEATQPYHGAWPRATDFDRPVDFGLGATMGGLEEDVDLQIRKSKFSRRRRYRRHRVGIYVELKVINRGDRGLRQTSCGWVRWTWRTSREI